MNHHRWEPPRRYVVLLFSLVLLFAVLFGIDTTIVKRTSTVLFEKGRQEEKHYVQQANSTATKNRRSEPTRIQNETSSPPLTPLPKPQYRRVDQALTEKATIVVQLSGEMANNLHHIAHGIGLQHWAKEEFGIDCNIVLRHHEGPNNRSPRPKWKSARDNIQQCFPKLANWSFNEGNHKEFSQREQLQRVWLEGRTDHLFGLINSGNLAEVRRGLEFLAKDILTDPERPWVDEEASASSIRLPYLYSQSLDAFPIFDKYFSPIRDMMKFNDTNPACCANEIIPRPNDSVFHFRNYQSEMPDYRAYEMGFAELSPNKTAHEIFRHLPHQLGPGHKFENNTVHITTRIYNQKARNYAIALQERGINASLVTDQTGVQDFCFLKRAQKELVGNARSTFVQWAGFLGNASRVRLYHVDNWGLRRRHPDFWERFTYNFTHPDLATKIQFELYPAEEMTKK